MLNVIACPGEEDSLILISEEVIAWHIEDVCAKIIDFDSYYEFNEVNIKTNIKTKNAGKRAIIADFPDEIQVMIQKEGEVSEFLEQLNEENIDIFFPRFLGHTGSNFDKIKDLVITCLMYSDRNPKKISSITQLLSKFLVIESSNLKYLLEKALIEVFMKFKSDLNGHKIFIYNICKAHNSDLVESVFFSKSVLKSGILKDLTSEEARSLLAIFQTDNLNDFIDYTSINFNLSEPIDSKLFFGHEKLFQYHFKDQTKNYLIDLAADYSAVKIFKYLWLNNVVESEKLYYYSIAGGNLEITRLLVQDKMKQNFSLQVATKYHRNEILYWILDQQLENLNKIWKIIIINLLFSDVIAERNLEAFLYLITNFNIKIKEKYIYQSIESHSYIIYRILKLLVNNKYYVKELEKATNVKFHPVIRYILNFHHKNIIITQRLELTMFQNLNYYECKAILAALKHTDKSYDFYSNFLQNWDQYIDISIDYLHKLTKFGITFDEIEQKFFDEGSSLLGRSIQIRDDNKLFNFLISDPKTDVNKGEISPFLIAIDSENLEALEKLIQHPDICIKIDDFPLDFELFIGLKHLVFDSHFLKLLSTYEKTKGLFNHILMGFLVDFSNYCSERMILKLITKISDIDCAKSIVGSNGKSILVIIASLCNCEACKVLIDNGFKYINPKHVPVFDILRDKRLETCKIKLLKLKGFSALDFTYEGEYFNVYNFAHANELLQLNDLNVDFILNDVMREFGKIKTENNLEIAINNLKLAINHPNLGHEVATSVFYDFLIGIDRCFIHDEKLSFHVLKIIYEKFGEEIRSNFQKDNSIISIIQYNKFCLERQYNKLAFILKENLYCYDQFIRFFRDLINIFMSPKRIKFLLSVVKENDFESCVLMSLDEALKRIERGEIKDVSKYFFLFCFKNTCYNKLNIISRVVMISDFNVSISMLSFLSTNTNIDPNYVDLTKCENPPLHFAIIENKTYVVILLLSFQNVNLRLKNYSGITPLALCKQQNKKDLYSMIAYALLHNEEKFSTIVNKLIQPDEDKNSEILAAKGKIFATL